MVSLMNFGISNLVLFGGSQLMADATKKSFIQQKPQVNALAKSLRQRSNAWRRFKKSKVEYYSSEDINSMSG